jgi:hypothetical protein
VLAVQIFDTKGRAIVATLGVECSILVLLAGMSVCVLRRFSRDDVDDDEKDASEKASEKKGRVATGCRAGFGEVIRLLRTG